MALLKLYQVTPTAVATQVVTTSTPVRQVILSSSTTFSIGDKTLTSSNGIVAQTATIFTLTIGSVSGNTSFDLSELYVYIPLTGPVNILAIQF